MSNSRIEAVRGALDTVLDPELDASLTALGFVHSVQVEGRDVAIALRLPTYWCAANFAYIMGEDAIEAVGALDWVASVRVELVDHFAARRVNSGLAKRLTFAEAFQVDGDLAAVRASFADKAYMSRQVAVLQTLRRELPADAIVAMRLETLRARGTSADDEHAGEVARYLEARAARSVPCNVEHLAFLTLEGGPIAAKDLLDHLRTGRRIAGSMAANGEMCRMLLAARYGPHAAPRPLP